MRRRVIAHGRSTGFGIDYGVNFVADANRLLGDDLVGAHSLNRVVAAGHVGDDGVVIVGIEPSAIANLPAGFSVERRVIDDDLALVAGLQFLCALAGFDDGQHFAVL